MVKVVQAWLHRYFSDPEAILLLTLLVGGFATIIVFGHTLIPVLISIVIAYLLRWWVTLLERFGTPPVLAYSLVYFGFLAVFVVALLIFAPLLWRQVVNLLGELPAMVQNARDSFLTFIDKHPAYVSEHQIELVTSGLAADIQTWGKRALTFSLSSIPGMIAWLVYLILVPLLVFFFLKDHRCISDWFVSFLPRRRGLLTRVWGEMDQQIGNYVRGKITEILIVGVSTYVVFFYFDLKYQFLLASLVGLSVIIPYIGAVVVTIPVALVGYLQWGWDGSWSSSFPLMMLSYLVIQFLDGNLLVPLLFSEAVNLHPVAIIVAILIFGSFWGFWGVFFAIPLATLVKAVIYAWPRRGQKRATAASGA